MRSLFAIVSIALLVTGCGSSGGTRSGPAATPSPVTDSPPIAKSETPANAPAPVAASTDPNDYPVGSADRKRLMSPLHHGPEPPLPFRPAPENSRFATTMNQDGQPVEVRVFDKHPVLARVEATWLSPSEKLLKITLRSGKAVDVKTEEVTTLQSAPTELLLRLAGASK